MTLEPLDRLFRPCSIAVVGGGTWCENVIRRCREMGFSGPIWPVHPTRAEVAREPAFARIADLPDRPDAAFVGVNREATINAVAALSARGAGGAVCFAAGFAEAETELAGARDLQARLIAAAGPMRILGPNCYGFVNYLDGVLLWPDQHGGARADRGVAIVTQSSNIAINLTMQRRGLPVAYVVTAGNQAQTGLSEIGAALIADPRVTALGLHIEGVGDIPALESLATKARSLGKAIVALKVGRSREAQAATISHTASLAGSETGARALLERLGIVEVTSLPVLLETLKLLHVAGPLPSASICTVSCSGGEASLAADTALAAGLVHPLLSGGQRADLAAALGPKVALANPLDYHTYIWNDEPAMTAAFTAVAAEGQSITTFVVDYPRTDRCSAADWEAATRAIIATRRATGHPVATVATLAENMPEDVAARFIAAGVAPLMGMEEAFHAIAAAARAGRRTVSAPVLLPAPGDGAVILTEADAKAVLAAHGLHVPKGLRATCPEDAAKAAASLGFPVALKGEGVAHKSEAGKVALTLQDAEAVRAAAQAMGSESYLIERMVTDAVAELLVGVLRDPAHGFVLTLGAGGILTEILCDTVSLMVPATPAEIDAALDRLRIAPLLVGYRGRPAADRQAIVEAVLALQDYVIAEAGRVAEVEVNPLVATASGAIAVDALIRKDTP